MMSGTHVRLLAVGLSAVLAGCDGAGVTTPTQAQAAEPLPAPGVPGSAYGNGFTLMGVSLYGVVSEVTSAGLVPLPDVTVYCDACGATGHTWTRTDIAGTYRFNGDRSSGGGIWLSSRPTPLWLELEGFDAGWREVAVSGDTRFDIGLSRR